MALIRFPYSKLQGKLEPVIPLGVKIADNWERVDTYVDSGAEYTVLQSQIADRNQFAYRTGQSVFLRVGNGGLMQLYLHDLEVQLGSERLLLPIGFSDQLQVGFNVLGKRGIFDRFKVCFQAPLRVLTFELLLTESNPTPH